MCLRSDWWGIISLPVLRPDRVVSQLARQEKWILVKDGALETVLLRTNNIQATQ